MKNVLIISASPRKHGNSDTLCDYFAKGAQESGNHVERSFWLKRILATVLDVVFVMKHIFVCRKMI